jgi:hypothetical protein
MSQLTDRLRALAASVTFSEREQQDIRDAARLMELAQAWFNEPTQRSGPLQRTTELKRTPLSRLGKIKAGALSRLKPSRPKTTPIRQSARDEECTLRLPGCNLRTDTTVLCHSNKLEHGKGMGIKASDLNACYSCGNCHDCLDGRAPRPDGLTYDKLQDLFTHAVAITRARLKAKGLIKESP